MISQEYLRSLLAYDPETGEFTWRINRMRVKAGQRAGSKNSKGYIIIEIDGRGYRAHRLAWFYTYGTWPTPETDHINRIRADNRIANLREATPSLNNENRVLRGRQGLPRSGYTGVDWYVSSGRWRARYSSDGRQHHLGYFDTPELAAEAIRNASAQASVQ